jgi:hypothetical protein
MRDLVMQGMCPFYASPLLLLYGDGGSNLRFALRHAVIGEG